MPDATTPNYALTEPTVNADNNTWGTLVNGDLVSIDQFLGVPAPIASAGVAVGATTTINIANGIVQSFTLTQATTLSITNPTANVAGGKQLSQVLYLVITNGGAFTITWPVAITWANRGVAPALSPSGVDVVVLWTLNNGVNWYGGVITGTSTGVRVLRNGAHALTAGADTVISWDTKDYDTTGTAMWAAGANQSRLVAPVAGLYHVAFGWVAGATVSAGVTVTRIKKNGATVITNVNEPNVTSPAASILPGGKGADIVSLAAGDYIEIFVNSPATSLSVGSANGTPFCSLVRVSA